MKAKNIIWDIDELEYTVDFPKEVEIPEGIEDGDEIADYLMDYLIDKTGYCFFVKEFTLEN